MSGAKLGYLDAKLVAEKAYWLKKLSGELARGSLPTDFKRPEVLAADKDSFKLILSENTAGRLLEVSGGNQVLVFTILTAALKLTLHSYSGLEEIVVGTTIHRRYNQIASLNKVLVLRDPVTRRMSAEDLLHAVKHTVTEAFLNQKYPFERILALLRAEPEKNRGPLFDVAVALESIHDVSNLSGLNNDITLSFATKGDETACSINYSPLLFAQGSIEVFAENYAHALWTILTRPKAPIGDLDLLTPKTRRKVLYDFNDTIRPFPSDRTIQQLFEQQVEIAPDRVAIEFGEIQISYGELNRRANQLAQYLEHKRVESEEPVGVYLERGPELIVGLLAILKAGCAYLPLDTGYPQERLAFMLAEAGVRLLISQMDAAGRMPEFQGDLILVDRDHQQIASQIESNRQVGSAANGLAYIIYTSGSTGLPKGVSVSHRSVVRLVTQTGYAKFDDEIFLHMAPVSFDASTFEIWGSLLNGSKLVVMEAPKPTLSELGKALRQRQVTTLWLTAGLFHLMVDEGLDDLRGIKQLLAGGDVLSPRHVSKVLKEIPGIEVINGYGPTESTTFACCHVMMNEGQVGERVAIGRPIANTQAYIADAELRPLGIGMRGELYIGGDGLARGYIQRTDLTAERFLPDPFNERGGRLYRTGDEAQYLSSGEIEFLGRRDGQVKIRGYRVELGEVESLIAQTAEVKEVAVVAWPEADGKRLVAYLVLEGETEEGLRQVRESVRRKAPEYMWPTQYVTLQRMPLTPNGKTDRSKLPLPNPNKRTIGPHYPPPSGAVEEIIAGTWAEVLQVKSVGPHDNFFDLGGHSLLATQIVSRIRKTFGVELPLRALFHSPTVALLSKEVEQVKQSDAGLESQPLEPLVREDELPLSFAQKRLWFLSQLEPDNSSYNIPAAVRLEGSLNLKALEQTMTEIVRRHEALRTTFTAVEGRPIQVINPARFWSIPVVELRGMSSEDREVETLRLAKEEAKRPFDLAQGPLLRMTLLRTGAEEHVMLFTMHHIVSDGWSMGVLIREIAAHYEAYSNGTAAPLPELPMQYADFTQWQHRYLQGAVLDNHISYWKTQLEGAPGLIKLPTDRPRPSVQRSRGSNQSLIIPASVSMALKALSRREGVTLFMTLLAAYQTLLHRYSGESDIVLGTDVANRNRFETEGLIGFFVNMLVLRVKLSSELTFKQLLARVREITLDAHAHQDLPFERIVEELQPARNLSHMPLFQVVFTLQNGSPNPPAIPGLTLTPLRHKSESAKFDIVVNLWDAETEIVGGVEYNTDLFDDATISSMNSHFITLLKSVGEAPDQKISELRIISQEEEKRLAYEWNGAPVEYPRYGGAHQLIEAQADGRPDRVAVEGSGEAVSYGELERRANQLAGWLRAKGVGRGANVGIYLRRGGAMVVGILGTLKSGAAYVPLEPGYPWARTRYQMEDAGVRIALTEEELSERLPAEVERLCLDRDWGEVAEQSDGRLDQGVSEEDLAYVIYTSGSTGRPKGVAIQHRALKNYLWWAKGEYVRQEEERFALYSSLGFDLTVTSLYLPLVSGGVVIAYRTERPEEALEEIISGGRVSVLKLTPSHLKLLSGRDNRGSGVRGMIVGGEALAAKLAEEVSQSFGGDVEIYNEYGPTEATVGCMSRRYSGGEEGREWVPIGRAGANVRIYIMGEGMRMCGEMEEGEIYIGGEGLAAGYWREAEQTAKKFLADPYVRGEVVYVSGDRGRMTSGGEVEYLGRRDGQVKYHGMRVELSELESALKEHEQVRDSVVVLRKDGRGEEALIGYYVSRVEIGVEELREHLRARVPEETMPNYYAHLSRMPLTINGKLNYEGLPGVEEVRKQVRVGKEGARNEVEELMVGIWREVLGLDQVGIHDNFFELGGHSLIATQVISRAHSRFGADITLRDLFAAPTVAGIAKLIEDSLIAKVNSEKIDELLDLLERIDEDGAQNLLSEQAKVF